MANDSEGGDQMAIARQVIARRKQTLNTLADVLQDEDALILRELAKR